MNEKVLNSAASASNRLRPSVVGPIFRCSSTTRTVCPAWSAQRRKPSVTRSMFSARSTTRMRSACDDWDVADDTVSVSVVLTARMLINVYGPRDLYV